MLIVPRLGWVVLVTAITAYAAAQGHAGPALVAAIAMLVPIVLLPLRPTAWPLGAGAPALGLIGVAGLAGAWPALAGLAHTAWRRAAIGAAGWIALVLTTPIAGADPVSGARCPRSQAPTRSAGRSIASSWRRRRRACWRPRLVWAAAAAILPLVVRGRSLALDLVRTGHGRRC